MNDEANDHAPSAKGTSAPMNIRNRILEPQSNPDIREGKFIEIVSGPRHFKVARYWLIVDRHTGEINGEQLTIETYRTPKGKPDEKDDAHSITLASKDGDDELQRLVDFIQVVRSETVPSKSGDFIVVPNSTETERALVNVLDHVRATGQYDALAGFISAVGQDDGSRRDLLEGASNDPQLFAEAATTLNLVTRQSAVESLKTLIDKESVLESEFQKLLEENPWLFGSEYSERLHQRKLTRDEQQDLVMRRTTDGYIEIIEIKTPLSGRPLFRYDESHKSYFAVTELSKVIGQVQKYLEELDANRSEVLRRDSEDTNKVRAKIIIGRDGDEEQKKALRRFNGHLHRIEVITFDQLLNIAYWVVRYLENALLPDKEEGIA